MTNPDLPARLAPRQGRDLDVICIGTALMDHLALVDTEVLSELGFVPGTMTLVDETQASLVEGAIGTGTQVSGGTVANTAVGVSSLGGKAAFIGAVGKDAIGAHYAADLEHAGVGAILEHVANNEAQSGRCFVLVTPDAERTMATMLGAGPLLDHDAIDPELFARAQIVYFDGYVLDFPDAERLVRRIVEVARETNTALALGLADPLVVERHHASLVALVDQAVDLIFANETEAIALTGTSGIDEAVAVLRRRGPTVMITRGENGAVVANDAAVIEIAAEAVAEVVDVTGAGDLFAAGALFGLSHGLDLRLSGRLGATCAAEVISHLGARPQSALASRVAPIVEGV